MCDVSGVRRFEGNTATVEKRYVGAALALCGVQYVDVLGVTVVVTALPRMLTDLGASSGDGTMIVTAYAMFFGGLLMVASRIGDRVGHRRLVLAALVLFVAASAMGAVAPSASLLTAARALQGVAAAASVPSALRLLTTVVPEGPDRRRAVAWWSAAGAAAGASGFVVGGVLTELVTWRAVFWMNIALAALLAGSVLTAVPRDPPNGVTARIGLPSALLLTGAAMGVVAGTTLLGEAHSRRLAAAVTAAGIVAAVAFVLVERGAAHPLVPPAARRVPALNWGVFGSFFNTATTSSSVTVATLYLQGELGLSPLRAAGLLITFSILVVVGSLVAPRLLPAIGARRSLGCGLGVIAVGNGVLVAWPDVVGIAVASGLCGLGIGIGSVAATAMGTDVDEAITGTAAGMINTAAQLGTAVGTAFILLISASLDARAAWVAAGVIALVAGAGAAARESVSDRRSAVVAGARESVSDR